MPAAAVIPAPIAYIKVVAVKKLVVEPWWVVVVRVRPRLPAYPPLWEHCPLGRRFRLL